MHPDAAARLQSLVQDAMRAKAAGDVAAAVAIAEQAAQERLGHPALLRIRAEALLDAGRIEEAGKLLNRALALAPRDSATILGVGRLLIAEDRTEEAILAFRAATEAQPDLVDAWNALEPHAAVGQLPQARIAFGRAVELAPQDPDPRANFAFMEARAGRHEWTRAWPARLCTCSWDTYLQRSRSRGPTSTRSCSNRRAAISSRC